MDLAYIEEMLQEREAKSGPKSGWQQALSAQIEGEVKWNEPLRRYSTIQIGGPADALVLPANREDLQKLLQFAQEWNVPWMVLGFGSNVLIRDGGIRGIVIRLQKILHQLDILEENDEEVLIQAEAGVALPKIVEMGRQKGWQGVDAWYGIPASVGGAISMNAGTRHGEIQNALQSVEYLLADGTLQTYKAKRLKFSYRQTKFPSRGIVLSGQFRFKKIGAQEVDAQLREYQKRRHETQPLDSANFGSVFKNPEKGFAAQMIEELNLKGVRVGGARISDKHANFIINERQATAKDVLALIGLARDKVKEHFGVNLETEVKIIGEDDDASEK